MLNLKKICIRKKMIEQATTAEELLKLMRKPLSGGNRRRLRRKILEYETVMMPLIKEKTMKNGQDIFIENTLYFFGAVKKTVAIGL